MSSEESIGTKHGISGTLDTGNAWLLVLPGCTACTGDFSGQPQEPVESADPVLAETVGAPAETLAPEMLAAEMLAAAPSGSPR